MSPSSYPIHLQPNRTLDLEHPSQPGRPSFVAAASGLVATRTHLYVVADDELALGIFPRYGTAPGHLRRLVNGELPIEPSARKHAKADFESLVQIPACEGLPFGALLAMGSASKTNRCRGVLLPFTADGATDTQPSVVDLTSFFDGIAEHVGQVNIEGAFFMGDLFVLLQRGNKGDAINAIVTFARTKLLERLTRNSALERVAPLAVQRCDLGVEQGVPLGFTDGAALSSTTFVFSAVAENTADAVADGECVGSAIGLMTVAGEVVRMHPLESCPKVEGIHSARNQDHLQLLLVTDADDPAQPARLLSASVSL